MSSCEDSQKSDTAEYFIFPRKAGGFIFSVVTPTRPVGGGGQQLQTREEANADFRTAAYTAIGK